MTVLTLCFDLVFILFIAFQCQSTTVPPVPNGWCSAGFYKKENVCVKCEDDRFMDAINQLNDCRSCSSCDKGANQVELTPCTSTQDRRCVCEPGFYESDHFCKACQSCQNCSKCSNCTEKCNPQTTAATTAVDCRNGYFLDGGRCQSCVEFSCKSESCKYFCTKVETQGDPQLLFLVSLIIVALLGGLLCLLLIRFCRWKWLCCQSKTCHIGEHPNAHIQPADQPNDAINIPIAMERYTSACNETSIKPLPVTSFPRSVFSGDLQSIMAPLMIANGNPKLMQMLQKESWPAPVLYTIIREIPVTRWKEFLRLLSVSDDQMERIELEAVPSYLEKQYMMLRLWSQSSGAKLENIYSTLHYMNLSGCAQELQEKLEQLQASM
ncbi:unnamed protein product [Leuciscus chuanchicus]